MGLVSGVGSWGERSKALDGAVGQSGQDISQVLADWNAKTTAALDHREDGGDLRAGFLAARWSQFRRPIATGLFEFSARLFDSSSSGYWRNSVSFVHSESV